MSSLEQHPQWPAVLQIHQKLVQAGYRSLIAGGAVRDLLLGRTPNDIDIATDARPEQVESLFEKTVMVGKEFGVSRVIIDDHDIEVATFRSDGEYLDGRKPQSIEFTSEKEDALRRDFTINAMFYDPIKKEVLDYVGGQKDLMQKTIRTVGIPKDRFKEDKLRILRAFRFVAQLNFIVEQPTQEAIKLYAPSIHQVSMERIRDEWEKLMMGAYAISAIGKVYDFKLWPHLFPNWNYQPQYYSQVWGRGFSDPEKAWVVWFLVHVRESKEKLAELGFQWKFSKDLIRKILFCYQSLPLLKDLQKYEPVDIAIFLGQSHGRLALDVYRRLNQGKAKPEWEKKLGHGEEFFRHGPLAEPLVTGDDLIRFGMVPGPEIAKTLKDLYRNQLKYKVTHKEELLKKLTK